MPPLPPVVIPDGEKICRLIRQKDQERGALTRFARRLGRHPQSFWNIKNGKPCGLGFITQVADALGEPVEELLSKAGETSEDAETEPNGAAA